MAAKVIIHKPGDKIGTRILIEEIDNENYPNLKIWKWKCDFCGNEDISYLANIIKYRCNNCGRGTSYKPGDRVGTKILIEEIEKNGSTALRKWRWKCIFCGNIGVSQIQTIKISKKCRKCRDFTRESNYKESKYVVGKKLGSRVLVEEIDKEGQLRFRKWKWKCDCGNEGINQLQILLSNKNCPLCKSKKKVGKILGIWKVLEHIGFIYGGKNNKKCESQYRVKCMRCGFETVKIFKKINKNQKVCSNCRGKYRLLGKFIHIKDLSRIFDIKKTTIYFRMKNKSMSLLEAIVSISRRN